MARRPVFVALADFPYVKVQETEFKFYPGFADSQYRKSIESLHHCFVLEHHEYNNLILEVSTKSNNSLGVHLSAFNLMLKMSNGEKRFVENIFQSSKCFTNGGPYKEILNMTASEAKRFPLLKTSGPIIQFKFDGKEYSTEPKTFFYDWLYINALNQNKDLSSEVITYRAFTDMAFNPSKSINCQARSVALYVALKEAGKIEEALSSPEKFLNIAYETKIPPNIKAYIDIEQLSMF